MAGSGLEASDGSKWREFQFKVPERLIKTDEDLQKWFKSQVSYLVCENRLRS
jgi:hypothetical protein